MGKVLFSQVCICSPPGGGGVGGVTPSHSHKTSTSAIVFPSPRCGCTPVPGRRCPRPRWGCPRVHLQPGQDDILPPWPRQDGVTPPTPPQGRTAQWVLAMRRAVCLLRSCRRTVLLVSSKNASASCPFQFNVYFLLTFVSVILCPFSPLSHSHTEIICSFASSTATNKLPPSWNTIEVFYICIKC